MNKFFKKIKSANNEFKNSFKAVGKTHVYKNRKTIIKSCALCFIPFLYAFIALCAFFNPLGNINHLPIALVNADTYNQQSSTDNRIVNLKTLNLDGTQPNSLGAYAFTINMTISNEKKDFTVYYFNDEKTYIQHKDDTTFLTAIIITPSFTNDFNNFFNQVFHILTNDPATSWWQEINNIANKPQITLQASYKVSPILGEINDFASFATSSIFGKFLPIIISDQIFQFWQTDANKNSGNYEHLKSTISDSYSIISMIIPGMGAHAIDFKETIKTVVDKDSWTTAKNTEHRYWNDHTLTEPLNFIIINSQIEGKDKSPYGFGLGPYFMCIGMWVGTLLLTFTFTRNREVAKSKFWSNYLAKSAWMVLFGLVQSTILTTSLLLLFNNVDLWSRCWQMYLYLWFMGVVFDLIIQALAHMFRDHDIGRFLIVILLILQLSSSSGTFPVALEPKFFQFMYHILPFSYAIKGLREILILPNPIVILWTIGCLLLFVIVFVSLSLFLNWLYDWLDLRKKTKVVAKKIELEPTKTAVTE